MSSTPELPNPEAEQAALACYLGTVVAIGNCIQEVCPSVGAMYRDRLLRLPRRLGFDATPQALQQSREAVETDLIEYSRTAGAWIAAGSNHAAMLLEHLRATEETLAASADLQRAFLDDLAEHIATSAEVDEEAQLRVAFKRYAAGLRAYSRRALTEKLATIDDLRRRREDIDAWLTEATASNFTDSETGLPNRPAAERRILTQVGKQRPFCVILVGSRGLNMKELADRLAATIRPYDVVFRWSQDELMTIFEASQAEIAARARQIGGWLGEGSCAVTVVEQADEEPAAQLIARMESVSFASHARR
jgi:GGDEF domain-containing protein